VGKKFIVSTTEQNEWGATQKEVKQKQSISRAERLHYRTKLWWMQGDIKWQ